EAPATAAAERAAAQSYDAEAAAYRAEAAESRREAAAYAAANADGEGTAAKAPNPEMQQHCESRAALADKLAANAEKLAAFHAKRAKEIEARTKRQAPVAAPKR